MPIDKQDHYWVDELDGKFFCPKCKLHLFNSEEIRGFGSVEIFCRHCNRWVQLW